MPRYRAIVAYDGTDFHGWQKQPGYRSVQEDLENAILPLSPDGTPVDVHGSGRTDAGVHARGQVAHFDLARDIQPASLCRAINMRLQPDARILRIEPAEPDFDARRSAHSKEYRYRIFNAEHMDPSLRRHRCHVSHALDVEAMRRAARDFVGEHDFAAFSANPQREVETTVRTIYSLDVVDDLPEIEIRVVGNGFLYKMVRSISGYLISIGLGKAKADSVPAVIESKLRTARVESAPACGLFLWRVHYSATLPPPPEQPLFKPYGN